jgi:hypothetical protein
VTWGIELHARVICSAVRNRTLLIGSTSTGPQREKSGNEESTLPSAVAGDGATLDRTNAVTSSALTRPPGPLPRHREMSTPSSARERRTDGAAGTDDAAGAGAEVRRWSAGAGASEVPVEAPAGEAAAWRAFRAVAVGRRGAGASASPPSR